jgi:hypothetical protein
MAANLAASARRTQVLPAGCEGLLRSIDLPLESSLRRPSDLIIVKCSALVVEGAGEAIEQHAGTAWSIEAQRGGR